MRGLVWYVVTTTTKECNASILYPKIEENPLSLESSSSSVMSKVTCFFQMFHIHLQNGGIIQNTTVYFSIQHLCQYQDCMVVSNTVPYGSCRKNLDECVGCIFYM